MPDALLWTLQEIVAATGGRPEGEPAETFAGVSIDSRTVSTGEIFVAIRGDRLDGHAFVASALESGAGLAVVDRRPEGVAGPLLVVDDTLRALEDIGRAARERFRGRVVAVTGSVGKTGTKEALRLVLGRQGAVHAAAGSHNNHWGVPLTLARLPANAAYGVFEVGMNHAGEIAPLTRLIRPHVAIVTAIAPVHIGHFDGLDAIADAKAEIFLGLEPGGIAIVNGDGEHCDRLRAAALAAGAGRVVAFGRRSDAEARLLELVLQPDGSTVSAEICGTRVTYRLGAPGEHLAINSLAILAAVEGLGADLALAALALRDLRPPKGRGVRFELAIGGGSFTLVDESYNANPASMHAALKVLGQAVPGRRGRRIAVIGDMLELGDRAPQYHAELAASVAEAGCDLVYACGPNMTHLWDALPRHLRGSYAETSEALLGAVKDAIGSGDVVMVKGSAGSRMGLIVDALLDAFPRIGAGPDERSKAFG